MKKENYYNFIMNKIKEKKELITENYDKPLSIIVNNMKKETEKETDKEIQTKLKSIWGGEYLKFKMKGFFK